VQEQGGTAEDRLNPGTCKNVITAISPKCTWTRKPKCGKSTYNMQNV